MHWDELVMGNINANARFNNNYSVFGGLGINPSGLNFDHLRGGPAIATSFGANIWYGFNSDDRKDFSFGYFGFTYYSLDKVFSSNISPYISFRPRKNIQFSLNPEYKYFDDTWAWVSSFEDSKNEKHYIFSDILQKTFSLTMRLNVTLRTNLSVQFYASPFLTAGHYENFREIDELREVDFDKRFSAYNDIQLKENQEVIYDDGSSESVDFAVDYNSDGIFDHTFSNPDFNYKQMNTNLVVRWEYNPGSTLYLVWSSGRSDYEQMGTFNLGSDSRRLFQSSGDNVFLLKFSTLLAL